MDLASCPAGPSDVLADLVAELGPLPPGADPLTSTLPRVTDLACRSIVVVAAASVTLVERGRPRTVAASGPLASQLDEQQYWLDSGPCPDAARDGRQRLVDHRTDLAYPDFSAAVRSAGVSHTLSIGLGLRERPASLNLYVCTGGGVPAGVRDRADQLAGYAAVVMGATTAGRAAVVAAEQLRAALQTRAVVETACGIVMQRRGLDPEAARQVLVADAARQGISLRVLAQRVVDLVQTY